MTHRTISNGSVLDSTSEDPEPNYDISLDYDYQDFASYVFMGNRIENFTAYFNTFFKSTEDFDEAMTEYRASAISVFNSRLDSLGVVPPVTGNAKEKLNKVIERSSKIIQFHKNSKFIDNAVLLIGKSYYFLGDYLNAERKFNEFILKLSSSENADEAILYLGRSKLKLNKKNEGETIIKNLTKEASDKEIKSLASRDLGIIEYNRRNIEQATNNFKSSIEFSNDNERKAEGQFILAKILSIYKPGLAAEEFKKVLDYTSDFDLSFYAKLNYAKGLIYNKDFRQAEEELQDLRKKYREVPAYTQLVDLEIANTLYGMEDINEAKDKYYEVIIKYPNSIASSDAYYFLAKHEEEKNKNYLKALTNYQKAVGESNQSEFYNESLNKSKTLERYFTLLGEIGDSVKIVIPTANADLEKFRKEYNEERGIEQPKGIEGETGTDNTGKDGSQTGDGKGKPGGFKGDFGYALKDSNEKKIDQTSSPGNNPGNNPGKQPDVKSETENSISELSDSVKTDTDSLKKADKKNKIFNAYFELAELFMYNLNKIDSAEHYLKLLLQTYSESELQSKVLYTLANLYKNNERQKDAEEYFTKIVLTYPNTVYGYESKKILGIKADESDIIQKPIDEIISKALDLYNQSKYDEAILKLYEVKNNYPEDSAVAKAYYGIGYIYENNLVNKDSSMHYYKLLKEKYPGSEYALKVTPVLDYMASLEVKDSVSTDTTGAIVTDSAKTSEEQIKTGETEKTEEEIKPDGVSPEGEQKLSQEEIDKLLKETEQNENGK